MNRLQDHEQRKRECVEFFKQNSIWKRVFTGFCNKYASYGHFSGKVVVNHLSHEDIDALEGFFGQNYHGKKSVTISAEKFAKALSHSKYADISPQEILTDYFGTPLLGKAEVQALRNRRIEEIKCEFSKTFKETPAADFYHELETIAKAGIRNRLQNSNQDEFEEWKCMLWLCAKIYNVLPYRMEKKLYLAVFAARVTGNPHAFDFGTPEGNLLYQVIQMDLELRGIRCEATELFPAYKRQKGYLLAGIMINDISNYALLYHVHAVKRDGSLHEGMEGFLREKHIVQVPLNVIAEWDRIECVDNEIYIVENPSVFATICGEKSCMCMNGQPRLAGLIVLELLAKTGTCIYYSGDLDPEGMLIAQKLSQFYGGKFIYWHMTEDDYEECKSNEVLSERRRKMLEKITDPELVPVAHAIEKCKMAGYQENISYFF